MRAVSISKLGIKLFNKICQKNVIKIRFFSLIIRQKKVPLRGLKN